MKKTNSILDKKLMNYMSASAAILATGASATGQIIYTDVIPDQTVTGQNQIITIDLNNDMTGDFIAAVVGNSQVNAAVAVPFATGSACAGGNPDNEIMGSAPSAYNYVKKLANGAAVGATGPWLGTNCVQGTMGFYVIGQGSPYNEEWNGGVTDGYMGLKFSVGGNIHYGWARFDVSADQLTLTLKDYAYNATPNTPINAGDMGTSSVSENIANQVSLFNYNNTLKLTTDAKLTNGVMQIMNAAGQLVKEIKVVSGTQEYLLDDMAAGLYVVNVTYDQGVLTEKINIR
ncbi:MAG: T9SS type A sorting domain-containing protein [Vicingaceae bacterium]|nr:T9SS type A sorting domain-containing protein [Vicingaceae bacterium]